MALDFQHRAGGKTGSGGVASASESNRDRRERLRQLALETVDLNKDPYFMKNHLGSYECKLCLTLHNNEGSYLAHTQGKKHQYNLGRRAAKDAKETPTQPAPEKARVSLKSFVKIGRPGYRVTKQRDTDSGQQSLLFQIDYPEIGDNIGPRHRFMSAYEQRIEPPDRKWQYLLFSAEPYETIAFKVPSREVDKGDGKFWSKWNKESKQFFLQFSFKFEKPISQGNFEGSLPPPPGLRGPPRGFPGGQPPMGPPSDGQLQEMETEGHPHASMLPPSGLPPPPLMSISIGPPPGQMPSGPPPMNAPPGPPGTGASQPAPPGAAPPQFTSADVSLPPNMPPNFSMPPPMQSVPGLGMPPPPPPPQM